jgi:membrane-associated phospholipid phosphatase
MIERSLHRPVVRSLLVGLLPLLTALPAVGQSDSSSSDSRRAFFGRGDLYRLGLIAIGTAALLPADRSIAEGLQRPGFRSDDMGTLAARFKITSLVPLVYVGAGTYVLGRVTRLRPVADLALHGAEAIAIAGGTVLALKGVSGRARPRVDISDPYDFQLGRGAEGDDRYFSFPSTNTILAFATASVVTEESARWWPRSRWVVTPLAYGAASLVGFSRLYANAHWASDVFLAASLGTYAGVKVVRYNHAHANNRLDRFFLGVTPVLDAQRSVGLAWSSAW